MLSISKHGAGRGGALGRPTDTLWPKQLRLQGPHLEGRVVGRDNILLCLARTATATRCQWCNSQSWWFIQILETLVVGAATFVLTERHSGLLRVNPSVQ